MTATILVEIQTDNTDLFGVAADIQEELTSAGFEVLSAKPWSRPSQASPTLGSLTQSPGGVNQPPN